MHKACALEVLCLHGLMNQNKEGNKAPTGDRHPGGEHYEGTQRLKSTLCQLFKGKDLRCQVLAPRQQFPPARINSRPLCEEQMAHSYSPDLGKHQTVALSSGSS